MSSNHSTVLFLADDPRVVREWLPVAQALRDETPYEPLFALGRDCPQEWRDHLDQEEVRYDFIGNGAAPGGETAGGNGRHGGGWRGMRGTAKRTLLAPWVRAWRRSRHHLAEAKELVRRHTPAAVVLQGDRRIGLETALVRRANAAGVASLIVPVVFPVPGGATHVRCRSPNYRPDYSLDPLFNRLVARLFPRWVQYSTDYLADTPPPMFFYPPTPSVVAWMQGIMPRHPWALGGGSADRMAVESERARRHFAADGTPEEKMVVTGRPLFDAVHQQVKAGADARAEVCGGLGIDPERKLVVCSVPQLKEHAFLGETEHWQEIEFLLGTLGALPDAEVVLSLHPHERYEEYKPVADKYGATISTAYDIYRLIPVCDVFVSTFSSTVAIAIGCRKPAVVLDFYGLGYTYFDDCGGVAVVRDKAELFPLLERMLSDSAFYEELAAEQAKSAPDWIPMDGQSSTRVVREIVSLVNGGRP